MIGVMGSLLFFNKNRKREREGTNDSIFRKVREKMAAFKFALHEKWKKWGRGKNECGGLYQIGTTTHNFYI
jgi:hypothetical protein